MENKAATDLIKSTVLSMLPGSKVFLFGSRARGDYDKESDYDVLVITKETFAPKIKLSWRSELHYLLVHLLHAPVDVLLNSEDEVNKKRQLPGHVIQWAMEEAVEL